MLALPLSLSHPYPALPPAHPFPPPQEQLAVRPDLARTLSGEVLSDLPFTRQVVKEVLRFRPPAPMVPQVQRRGSACGCWFWA